MAARAPWAPSRSAHRCVARRRALPKVRQTELAVCGEAQVLAQLLCGLAVRRRALLASEVVVQRLVLWRLEREVLPVGMPPTAAGPTEAASVSLSRASRWARVRLSFSSSPAWPRPGEKKGPHSHIPTDRTTWPCLPSRVPLEARHAKGQARNARVQRQQRHPVRADVQDLLLQRLRKPVPCGHLGRAPRRQLKVGQKGAIVLGPAATGPRGAGGGWRRRCLFDQFFLRFLHPGRRFGLALFGGALQVLDELLLLEGGKQSARQKKAMPTYAQCPIRQIVPTHAGPPPPPPMPIGASRLPSAWSEPFGEAPPPRRPGPWCSRPSALFAYGRA